MSSTIRLLVLSLVMLLALRAIDPVAAQQDSDGIPFNCEYANGTHYRPGIFARYDVNNDRLVLVDWSPRSDHIIIYFGREAFWWSLLERRLILTQHFDRWTLAIGKPDFRQLHWDYDRRPLIASGYNAAIA